MWSAASRTAGARSCPSARASATSPPTNGPRDATWTCPGSVTPCSQRTETAPDDGPTTFAQDIGHNQKQKGVILDKMCTLTIAHRQCARFYNVTRWSVVCKILGSKSIPCHDAAHNIWYGMSTEHLYSIANTRYRAELVIRLRVLSAMSLLPDRTHHCLRSHWLATGVDPTELYISMIPVDEDAVCRADRRGRQHPGSAPTQSPIESHKSNQNNMVMKALTVIRFTHDCGLLSRRSTSAPWRTRKINSLQYKAMLKPM